MKNHPAILPATFFVLLNLFVQRSPAQSQIIASWDQSTIPYSELYAKVDSLRAALQVPALSMAIINHDKIVFSENFGYSDAENQHPVDSLSIFEAASLSKPLFAFWVMQKAEQGLIDLDKPLVDYLEHPHIDSAYRDLYRPLTARMVLCHRSGFPNHAFGKPISLSFPPDSGFAYSGEAYQYLARVLAHQMNLDFDANFNARMRNELLKPMGLAHSSYTFSDYFYDHKVFGHGDTIEDRNPKLGVWGANEYLAYASLHSNAVEYAHFLLWMLKGKGLQPESHTEMLKEHTHFKDDNPLKKQIGQTGWGLGFAQKQKENFTLHFHTGNNHVFQSYAMFIPSKNYGIVLFTNCGKMISIIEGLGSILGPQI